ncbi:MAG: ATP-dependent DNA helicase [Solirubrobacterales bacterium]
MTDEQLREVMRQAWANACLESAEQRPSMVIRGGKFALTVTNRTNWQRMANAAGVPVTATQAQDGDTLTCEWESVGDSIFGQGGVMAAHMAGYEERHQQTQMARIVQRAVEMGDNAIIEAATGVGKSLGYLAPLLAMGKTILISTSNKTLQNQLVEKDLPFLQTMYDFTFAVALGKSNYVCNLKVEDPAKGGALPAWYTFATDGVLDTLPVEAQAYRIDEDCLGKHCPLLSECFFYGAKQRRSQADVIVCNHALLAQHAKHPYAKLLPQTNVIVIDEAHAFPGYARSAMGSELTLSRVRRVASLGGGIDLSRLQTQLAVLATDEQTAISGRVETDVSDQLRTIADRLLDDDDDKAKKRAERIERLADELDAWCNPSNDVRWIERNDGDYKLVSQPAEIDSLVKRIATVPIIFCSATLAAPDLDGFAAEMGVGGLQAQLGSPFDYRRNATVYVPTGTVDPQREIERLVLASGGGAFLLFTSNSQLNLLHGQLSGVFRRRGLTVYKQGELSRHEIAKQFRADGNAVLFATRTFFEGVSIEGSALRLVVLDKLPFEPPSPLSMAQEVKRGFHRVTLAKMLLDLKQASGRLIRTQTDRGVIAVLDSRVHTKGYGAAVKRCLPPAPLTSQFERVREFYHA